MRNPEVFLFDEPLSNLDAALRVNTRAEIAKLHRDLAATMIYVTHDQVEAMTLADKIVVLEAGIVRQVGSPLELYHKPDNQFVAGFIGSPKMNFIPVEALVSSERGVNVKSPDFGEKLIPVRQGAVKARRQADPRHPARRHGGGRQGRCGHAWQCRTGRTAGPRDLC